MNTRIELLYIVLTSVLLSACQVQNGDVEIASDESKTINTEPMPNRWYSEAQVANGESLFLINCASCHKADASGTKDWKSADSSGKYPPPPLNGSAHTWHHSMDVLQRTILRGGVELGGVMPSFSETLNNNDVDEVIAYFQSTWPDEIYATWLERNK